MMIADLPFREVWAVDFEFSVPDGERPKPICLVARELKTGRVVRLWEDEFGPLPPYSIGPDSLFVAFYASAEFGCHLALNWPMPERVLDLFAEHRCLTNGIPTGYGNGLLGALAYHGLDGLGADEKSEMRALAMRGGPWTGGERRDLLNYCESDVVALARLLPAMLPRIDLPRALLRGRYMIAAARMEWNGVPIDVEMLARLKRHWHGLQGSLISEIDVDYGVFEGRTFKSDRFAAWLDRVGIPWPRLESGVLDLSDDTFRERAKTHPIVAPLRELRHTLSGMRLNDLTVGSDGRNRCLLSPFASRTGRNQPSNSRFIFGPSVWLRGLIQPPPGHAVAYIDWSAQEFGIAAALSGDPIMLAGYESGDPYIVFAKQAGAVPGDATKESHPVIRDQFKACALGVLYGLGAPGLADRVGVLPIEARRLMQLHREIYHGFWAWSDRVVATANTMLRLRATFGWSARIGPYTKPNFALNYPMQANGAEMLRLACCLATESGIEVVAPVHDAVMICAPFDRLDADIGRTRAAMAEASRIVLDGFELRTDASVVRYPDRYADKRGVVMWERVMGLLEAAESFDDAA
jgi:hypothetical protein